MTNKDRNTYSVTDTDGVHDTPVQLTIKTKGKKQAGNFVRARRAMGMTILTARYAVRGMMYNATVDKHGVITYTPLGLIPQKDINTNNISLCKAFMCSNNATCINAGGFACLNEYYLPTVDEQGIITYTPLRIAIDRLQQQDVMSSDSNGSCDERLKEVENEY